jgi:N-methylhydantoinase A
MSDAAVRLIGVDVGGTFTDVVAVEGNRIHAMKVPTDPRASERSVLAGAAELDVGRADIFNLTTTAGLNAVITRGLPKVAFLTTIGHRDILDRGRLWRPLGALTTAARAAIPATGNSRKGQERR